MPATADAVLATDVYRQSLLAVRARLAALLAAQWQTLDIRDLDVSYRRWLDASALILTAAQRHGIQLTNGYLARFLSAELATQTAPVVRVDPDQAAGTGTDGRPLAEVLAPPLYTVKIALAQRRAPDEALRMGLNRALRTAVVEYEAAPRQALDTMIAADRRIEGWRRVTSGNACGACLAAASGAIQDSAIALPVHGHCRCTKEPVVRNVTERFRRPTGRETFDRMTPAEQDALFAGRGGKEKADLIRSGQVPFDRLIAPAPMVHAPDGITEAPLEALLH